MANRTIQQKLVKMKRMRRAYLKSYSMKRSGPDPHSFGFIGDDGKYTSLSIGSRNKATQVVQNAWLEALFPERNPNDPRKMYVKIEDRTGVPHMVLARVSQSSSLAGSLQGEQKFIHQKLLDTEKHKLLLFMGDGENFFTEYKLHDGGVIVVRKSISYGDKRRCLYLYQQTMKGANSICWAESVQFSSYTHAQNSG